MFWVVVVDDDVESLEHISSILTKKNMKVMCFYIQEA